jgi:type IV pilus assembly protein PilW
VGYSGFYASFSVGVEENVNTPTDDRWNIAKSLQGFDDVVTANAYASITNIVAGTDAILLKRMVDISNLKTDSSDVSMTLEVSNGYVAGDVLIATDQEQASIFQISAANNTAVVGETTVTIFSGTSPQPGNSVLLNNRYGLDAEIGKLETVMYYLKTGSNGRTALFEAKLKTSANAVPSMIEKEMIADVEDMQISYGVDTDDNGSVDRFDNAATIETNNHWRLVRTVGISMLMASQHTNITQEKNSYSFNANRFIFTKDTTASSQADRRLRRSFTTYISLRNS